MSFEDLSSRALNKLGLDFQDRVLRFDDLIERGHNIRRNLIAEDYDLNYGGIISLMDK